MNVFLHLLTGKKQHKMLHNKRNENKEERAGTGRTRGRAKKIESSGLQTSFRDPRRMPHVGHAAMLPKMHNLQLTSRCRQTQ